MGFSVVLLLVAILVIQSGAAIAKQLFPLIGVVAVVQLRIAISALLLLLVCRPWRGVLSRADLRAIVLYGTSLGCMNLLFYLSLERLPLGIAVMLEFIGPLTVAVFYSRQMIDFLWVALTVLGIVLIFPVSDALGTVQLLDPVGIVFALAAAASWAFYIIFGKKAVASIPPHKLVSLGMLVGSFVVLPAFLMLHNGVPLLNLEVLLPGTVVAIFCSAIPFFLEISAMKNLPLKVFGILMSLEPAVGALSGVAFLGENLSVVQWFAMGCVVAASAGSAVFAKASNE